MDCIKGIKGAILGRNPKEHNETNNDAPSKGKLKRAAVYTAKFPAGYDSEEGVPHELAYMTNVCQGRHQY